MCRVHAGDAEAFAALLAAVAPQWRPYCHRGQSSGTTEDLRQELWLTLWQALQHQPPAVLDGCQGKERGNDR